MSPTSMDVPRLKTVTSLSGGKSSGYMWLKYPTDYCLFALVLTEDPQTAPRDPGVLREVQRRVPGFVGTTELEQTLVNVLRLEEKAGRPVTWVVAYEGAYKDSPVTDSGWLPKPMAFDALCRAKGALPDKSKRFCTETLKVAAVFWHCYLHLFEHPDDMVWMHIGYRSDEGHRWAKLQGCAENTIRYPYACPVGARNKRNKLQWRSHEYRIPDVPMLRDEVDHLDVMRYWAEQGWVWPMVSNCAMCFYHDDRELQHNYDNTGPQGRAVLDWAQRVEESKGARFDSKLTLQERLRAKQDELFKAREFSCFCTD